MRRPGVVIPPSKLPGHPAPGLPRAAAPAMVATREPGPDALIWACGFMILAFVWPVHGAFPGLAVLKPPMVALALGALLLILSRDLGGFGVLLSHRAFRAVLVLVALAAVSVPFSVYRRLSFDALTKDLLFNLGFMTILALAVRGLRDLEWLGKGFLIGAGLFVGASLAASAGGDRLSGAAYYDSNDLATMIVCALPFAVYFLRDPRSRTFRLVSLGLLPLLLYAHVLSGSRGGFLGLVAVVGALLVFLREVRLRTRLLVVGAGTIVLLATASEYYWERMRTILHPEQDYNYVGGAAAGRMEIWKRGLGYMVRGPFGIGLNAFSTAEGTSGAAQNFQSRGIGFKWSAAHNSFIQVGAELGVAGLACFLFIFGVFLRGLWRIGRPPAGQARAGPAAAYAQSLLLAFVGFIIAGFFVSFGYSTVLFFLFGTALGLLRLQRLGRLPIARPVPSPTGRDRAARVSGYSDARLHPTRVRS